MRNPIKGYLLRHRKREEPKAPGHEVAVGAIGFGVWRTWQATCATCGWGGRLRLSRFDAGEDAIAHQDTGKGPRNFEEVKREERHHG